jgi:hypothetical protein
MSDAERAAIRHEVQGIIANIKQHRQEIEGGITLVNALRERCPHPVGEVGTLCPDCGLLLNRYDVRKRERRVAP